MPIPGGVSLRNDHFGNHQNLGAMHPLPGMAVAILTIAACWVIVAYWADYKENNRLPRWWKVASKFIHDLGSYGLLFWIFFIFLLIGLLLNLFI